MENHSIDQLPQSAAAEYAERQAKLCQGLASRSIRFVTELIPVLEETGANLDEVQVHVVTCEDREHPYIEGLFTTEQ